MRSFASIRKLSTTCMRWLSAVFLASCITLYAFPKITLPLLIWIELAPQEDKNSWELAFYKAEGRKNNDQEIYRDLWQQIQREGDISRHHPIAEIKSKIWWKLIKGNLYSNLKQSPDKDTFNKKLQKQLVAWAKKNARDIQMQVAMSEYWIAHGKPDMAITVLEKSFNLAPHLQSAAEVYIRVLYQLEDAGQAQRIYASHRLAASKKAQPYLPVEQLPMKKTPTVVSDLYESAPDYWGEL